MRFMTPIGRGHVRRLLLAGFAAALGGAALRFLTLILNDFWLFVLTMVQPRG